MSMIHRTPALLRGLVVAALLSAATLCGAKVFQRIPMAGSAALLARSLQARHAYSCDVTINDAAGQLSILSARDSLDRVAADCLRAFGKTAVTFKQSESMAMGRAERQGEVSRILIIQPDERSPCTIMLLEQSRRDYERSLEPPAAHAMRGVPEYPGSVPEFHVADRHTRFELATSTAYEAPEAIYDTMRGNLTAAGWSALIDDPAGEDALAGIQFFQKGMDLCAVFVMPDARTGRSTITLLHKQPGNE